MNRRFVAVVFGVLAAALCSCDENDVGVCPAVINPGVEVEVRDALTGLPAASGAAGIVFDDSFSDSLRISGYAGDDALRMAAAWGRSGSYSVVIQKPGYRVWTDSHVVAARGRCGVITARIKARLVSDTEPVPNR